MDKEYRSFETRATIDPESRKVEGYALLFDTESKPMYGGELVERIASTALDGTLERSDVLCVVNHNPDRGVLARFRDGGGSLTLTVDEKGLKYAFDAPNTALGDEIVEALRRGDITESSFCFSCKKDKYDKRADGVYVRTILEIEQLYDVSPVYNPAYAGTKVSLRSFEDFKAEEERQEAKRLAEIKAEEMRAYYTELDNRY